jgi:hypothetical protein
MNINENHRSLVGLRVFKHGRQLALRALAVHVGFHLPFSLSIYSSSSSLLGLISLRALYSLVLFFLSPFFFGGPFFLPFFCARQTFLLSLAIGAKILVQLFTGLLSVFHRSLAQFGLV